jgi:aspartate carbamoyltransferase regulatory subunit
VKIVLAGEEDLENGPIPEVLERFSDVDLMVFSPPSGEIFRRELDRIRDRIPEGENVDLVAYCFPATYVSNIQDEGIDSKVVIDPPSGVRIPMEV